jgi:hypothetical protein
VQEFPFKLPVSDESKDALLARLDISADIQATACDIMAEELQTQVDGCERRLADLLDQCAKHKKSRSTQRRRKASTTPKPLTARQAEAVEASGDFDGDIPKAARRCGISPKAMRNRLELAWKKIGQRPILNAMKAKTRRLPTDKRGQEVVFSNEGIDDSDE